MKPGRRTTPHLWSTGAFLAYSGIASCRHAEALIARACADV
jgi:hypothetical protein